MNVAKCIVMIAAFFIATGECHADRVVKVYPAGGAQDLIEYPYNPLEPNSAPLSIKKDQRVVVTETPCSKVPSADSADSEKNGCQIPGKKK